MSDAAKPQRATAWALMSLVLLFAGPAVYMLLIDFPLMHATGAPAFALMAAGVAAGLVAAWRDRRIWVRLVCAVDILLLALWTYMFYGWSTLPEPTKLNQLTIAPDFTLPDHTGTPITLSAALADGPVLLVFYRGHW
jgi:hypothetical protein